MKIFLKIIIICTILITTGCNGKKEISSYLTAKFIGLEDIKSDSAYGSKGIDSFTNIVHGNYEVEKFESIKFYSTDFTYDINEVTEYIKDNIENNKELHKITILKKAISYQEHTQQIEEYEFLSNSENPYEYYDMEIYLLKDLEYDYPVAIKTRTSEKGNKILVEILFNMEKYNYSFTTYVSYKRIQ